MESTNLVYLIIEKGCHLTPEEKEIIDKPLRRLTREERRIHYGNITGKGEQIKGIFKEIKQHQGDEYLFDLVVENIINKNGEGSYLDQLAVDVLGPLKIYKTVRERAEEKGITLKGTSHSGGCTMILIGFMIVSAIILYLLKG
ncbi:MAG: hypothetical protein M0Z31_09495 [Clostridia bacterium]|nr:hypothetical protein [Clostridia bacterium]